MIKRPQYIALVLAVVSVLILLNLREETAARIKLAIGSLFLPLFGLANASHQVTEKAGERLISRSELLRQNEGLRQQNEEYRLAALQAEQTARENARLRQQLGWQQKVPWKLKLANVIARDPANWWRTIEIDLGTRDGIRANLPVLTPDGLVGRIASAGLTRSQAVLLGDPSCKIAASIEDENHDSGIVEAAGAFDGSFLTMSYISRNANLKPGQNVVTSGLGGLFPKGIPVGKIVDSRQVDFGLYTEARVKLAANLGGLEEVWVLFP